VTDRQYYGRRWGRAMISSQNLAKKENKNNVNNKIATGISKIKMQSQTSIS